ncbi:AMP-binding protein [Methylorubrum suomiense]|uniref:Long-chain-fatty-acid--CoA ligase n=1 Tax=Methylorubrum suomiense TaxID=144191 RepID=A0ABQ4UZ06_9HYPH|nr:MULTISPECIES: AMP-binding protein [Methylobacteriaceae]GJE77054.1 Long-chain-fatty-acid--CoA ligase [Methylorubrum suomiense]
MAENRSVERPWLSAYPPGIPHDIQTDALGTVIDLFDRSVLRFAERPALTCFGATLRYREVGVAAQAVAAWLAAHGFGRGDRIAVMMPNVPACPVTLLGVLVAGCTVVNVNPLYTPRELAAQLNDSGARVLFVLENFGHTVEKALSEMPSLERVVVAGPGDLLGLKGRIVNTVSRRLKKAVPPFSLPSARMMRFEAVLKAGRRLERPAITVEPGDLAFLQYTGGTTGIAKAAMLTHANIMANVEQGRVWFRGSEDDPDPKVAVTALPLYHIFALTACFFFFFRIGGCCLLIPNPRDIDGFVKTLSRTRFTNLAGVNTLFNALNNHPKIASVDWSQLKYVVGGGMAVQSSVAARWKAITGQTILEGYGLSETSPVVSANPLGLKDWSGTIGFPLPSTDVSIRGADGSTLPYGVPGELCVRGPQVMAGYWNRPEETRAAMTEDGFFRTGDVAVMTPDGQLRIVDRMKDMILVSGFNVYPNEVEDVLATHPAVVECAVVGAPCEESGEMVVAHVVLRDAACSHDALRAHARAGLTGYKVPRKFVVQQALPKTNVGKVLRRALRDAPTA